MARVIKEQTHLDHLWQEREKFYTRARTANDARKRRELNYIVRDISNQIDSILIFEEKLRIKRDHRQPTSL